MPNFFIIYKRTYIDFSIDILCGLLDKLIWCQFHIVE